MSTCTYIVFVAYDKDLPFPSPKSPTTSKKTHAKQQNLSKWQRTILSKGLVLKCNKYHKPFLKIIFVQLSLPGASIQK
jgi:hypothetical protein